jgi:hypothetical protein
MSGTMTLITRLRGLPTRKFVWAALTCMLVGWALDAVTGPLRVYFGLNAGVLEYLGGTIFWFGYGVLWVLLPVAAFRPESRFYLRGDCSLRARRFGFVLGTILIAHILIFIAFAWMWKGGFFGGA